MVRDIDRSELIGPNLVQSPVFPKTKQVRKGNDYAGHIVSVRNANR